jgi:DNA polymerase-3 subunit epsilon
MSIVNRPLCFVDIETSGSQPSSSRVIEVAVIRIERSKVVDSYQALINPGETLPWQITRVTGLTDDDLFEAPKFEAIAGELLKILDGSVFVAHNVQFDYGFLQKEFERMGAKFGMPYLCTVQLSRALFPQYRKHNLSALIERFGIEIESRHRAMGDTQAMVEFYARLLRDFDLDTINAAVDRQLRRQGLR